MSKRKEAAATAEARLIGCLMLDHREMVNVVDAIEPDTFADDKLGLVYLTMYRLFQEGREWDSVALASVLDNDGKLGFVGGVEGLERCINHTGSAKMARPYAEMVAADCRRRQVAKAGRSLAERAEAGEDPSTLADMVHDQLLQIVERSRTGGLSPATNDPADVLSYAETAHKTGGNTEVVKSGLGALDGPLSGFRRGQLIILAARPGMGKSALALTATRNAAIAGKVVAFWSLEMSRLELAQRVVAQEARLDLKSIINGRLEPSGWRKLTDACAAAREYMARVMIDDRGSLTPAGLRAAMRRAEHTAKPDLVVVDYIQLMTAPEKGESRQQEVSNISRNLKLLAKDFDVPVLALSQLSRAVEHRQSPIPVLSDLRESGALEQDADVVVFVNRAEDGEVTLRIAKQRNGPLGDRKDVRFIAPYAMFVDGEAPVGGDRFFS